jgi:hypothetical protein
MSYQTCIDCGTREHSRCYNSTTIRINNHTGRAVRPSDQQKLETAIRNSNIVEKVVDMVVIQKITQLTDAVLTLEHENRSLTQMLMRHIYDEGGLHPVDSD